MRMSWMRSMRVCGCALVVATAIACRPLTPRPEDLTPATGSPAERARTSTSDKAMGRDHSQQTYSRIEEFIEGRAPGVQVLRRTDGSFSLRIRGVSSPGSNNDPLVVIDGSSLQHSRSNNELASLNPQDVLRIEVLKDAASTAFYGMRGSNGVIVITTRSQ